MIRTFQETSWAVSGWETGEGSFLFLMKRTGVQTGAGCHKGRSSLVVILGLSGSSDIVPCSGSMTSRSPTRLLRPGEVRDAIAAGPLYNHKSELLINRREALEAALHL